MTTELGETVKDRTQDRMVIIEDLEAKIEDLSRELELKDTLNHSRMNESEMVGNDYSMERVSSLQRRLKKLQVQRNESFIKVKKLSCDIVEMWGELRVAPDTEFEKAIVKMTRATDSASPLSLSLATITVLEQKLEKLETIKRENEALVSSYAQRITALWDKLDVPEDERESFFSKTSGLGNDVVEACQEELERVETLRRTCMAALIDRAREEIMDVYARLHMPLDRLDAIERTYPADSEEVLDAYEREQERAVELYDTAKPLIALVEMRENIRTQKIDYEQNIMGDKERLLSKKVDRGRLIQEEKLRKSFAKLPALEEKLRRELGEWAHNYGVAFAYDGVSYLETMAMQADEEKRAKEAERMRKEREKMIKLGEEVKPLPKTVPIKSTVPKTPMVSKVVPVMPAKTPSTPKNKVDIGPVSPYVERIAKTPTNALKRVARAPLSPLSTNAPLLAAKKKMASGAGATPARTVGAKKLRVASPVATKPASSQLRVASSARPIKAPIFSNDQSIMCTNNYDNEDLIMNDEF
eukprot:gene1367-1570_t